MRPIKIKGVRHQISLIDYLNYKKAVREVRKTKAPSRFECEDIITKEKLIIDIEYEE